MAKKFTLKTSRSGVWEAFYPEAHWDNIENKPNNIINGADTGYTPVTGSLIYYEGGAFKTVAPSSDNEILTLENGIPKWKDVEPAYDSLKAIDYNKEYGYVVDTNATSGTTWGKIFSFEISVAYRSATFVFDVNYGYVFNKRAGRLKLYTRIDGDTNTLAEAYLYFERASGGLDMSAFKVRRYDNKAEIYVKTAARYEGVSLKLVQVLNEAGKTYLQDSTISNFTLHNVTNPTLTNTDIDNLSGEVTEPSLLPISIENNSNIRTQQAEFDYDKEGASVFFNQAEIYFDDRFNSFANTMFDLAVYHKMYETGHIPISKKNIPDTSNILATTREIATEQFYVTNSEWNSLLLADISSVKIEGTYNSSVFRNVTTSTNDANGYANITVNKNNPSGNYFISFKIVDEFGKEVITTHKTILGIPL